MIDAIESQGIVVNVNHTRRWMPNYVTAREVVRGGAIDAACCRSSLTSAVNGRCSGGITATCWI